MIGIPFFIKNVNLLQEAGRKNGSLWNLAKTRWRIMAFVYTFSAPCLWEILRRMVDHDQDQK